MRKIPEKSGKARNGRKKRLKILITNHHLNAFAGSETFTATLAEALKKLGHEVFVFSPQLSPIFAQRFKKNKIKATDNLPDLSNEKIDIIHAHHNTPAIIARSVFPNAPMIFVSHGRLPELEQPPSIDLGISAFIAVSEKGIERLAKRNSISRKKLQLIRNIVDTDKFKPRKPLNEKPQKLLVMSNHYTDAVRKVVESACADLGLAVRHIGLPENSVENPEDHINQADICVTLGRGAMESMACARNVIIFDMHGADGFVDEKNFFEIRKNNFSGCRYKKKLTKNSLKKEISKYDPALGEKLRALIIRENSSDTQVAKLLKIYEKAIREGVGKSQIAKNHLFNEFSYLEREIKNNPLLHRHIVDLGSILREKEQEIEQKNEAISRLERDVACKDIRNLELKKVQRELKFVKSSKFWKVREKYVKIKRTSVVSKYLFFL